ncbi:MAG: SoxR reducing system RseC family protein [Actinomycetota bacterium]
MDCRARVMEKEGKRALVRVARVNCAECGGCGLLARDREHTMEFSAVDRLGVSVGDEVLLKVPSHRLAFSYLTVFGLPLLVMAAAYFAVAAVFSLASGGDGTAAGTVAAVLCGLVSLWVGAKLADRLGLSPVIVEVLAPTEDSDGQGYVL